MLHIHPTSSKESEQLVTFRIIPLFPYQLCGLRLTRALELHMSRVENTKTMGNNVLLCMNARLGWPTDIGQHFECHQEMHRGPGSHGTRGVSAYMLVNTHGISNYY